MNTWESKAKASAAIRLEKFTGVLKKIFFCVFFVYDSLNFAEFGGDIL